MSSQQKKQHSNHQKQRSKELSTPQPRSRTLMCAVCEKGNHIVKDCKTFLTADRQVRWRLTID